MTNLWNLFWIMFAVAWSVSFLVGIFLPKIEDYRNTLRWCFYWTLFPFYFIIHRERLGGLRSWLLFLTSPFMLAVYFCLLVMGVLANLIYTNYAPC